MKYYKILREDENHNGLQFHTGRVDDPNEFQVEGSCVKGGIYFVPVTAVLAFIGYGPWIREVTVPDDAQMVKDPGTGPEKYRASSVVLGERERWADPVVLQRLLNEGADTHIYGICVICWVAEEGNTEAVRVLLDHGANIHNREDEALRWAAKYGHTEIVQLLLEYGANVHAHDDQALCWATENGHTETVNLLKSYMK